MEKKKIIPKLNTIFLLLLVGFFAGLLLLQTVLYFSGIGISVSGFTYWVFLLGYLYVVITYKLPSKVTLIAAFCLFVIASVLTVAGFRMLGELSMRYFLVLWIVGLVQSVIEYKKHAKK